MSRKKANELERRRVVDRLAYGDYLDWMRDQERRKRLLNPTPEAKKLLEKKK